MSQEDREALRRFVTEVRDVLTHVVRGQPELLGDAAGDLDEALTELEGEGILERVEQDLLEAEYADEPDERGRTLLSRVGLTGANLRVKLRGWSRAYEGWQSNGLTLRPVFRWANTILGSLAGVVGAAESLKEYKESVENAYEDVQELA